MRLHWLVLLLLLGLFSREQDETQSVKKAFSSGLDYKLLAEESWIDSVFNSLTPEERIAQLIMVPAYSNKSLEQNQSVTDLIISKNIGGVVFFQGGPYAQAKMTNYWQGKARTPLFVAIDGEWGLGMRMRDSTLSFPKQMTLGAISDESLIEKMGEEIGRQCKRLGIHINFAPVVDVNSNPLNPVINYRSFGEDRENVARKGIAYMKGMQSRGVLACAKHFPGHGDTDKDSHLTLPVIKHSAALMDSVDLYPFQQLIRQDLASVMVAHLYVPSLDPEQMPTTLSYKVITGLLKEKMGFNGLIITDALVMKGFGEASSPGNLEVKALEAGNDILLMPENPYASIKAISQAISSGRLEKNEMDNRCKKVLKYKYRAGLNHKQEVSLKNLYSDLHTERADWINQKLYEASVTVVKNDSSLLPLKNLDRQKIACVSVGKSGRSPFQNMMERYAKVDFFNLPADFSEMAFANLKSSLSGYDVIIIGLHGSSYSPAGNFGINGQMVRLVKEVAAKKKVVVDLFANPYGLGIFGDLHELEALIVSYQDDALAQEAAAKAIFGGIPSDGRLPVTASTFFPVHQGVVLPKTRLNYTFPEEVGLKSATFKRIDSLINYNIAYGAFPGCQILIAVEGEVIYEKSYGYHTYEKKIPVRKTDLFDLASLTKVAATTLAIMKLYEEGKIALDDPLGKYLPELKGSNKENLSIRNVMAHQARLLPFIPFYKDIVKNGVPDPLIFSKKLSKEFPWRVAEDMYIRADYPDSLFQMIVNSNLRESYGYRYSDLGFMMLKVLIEKVSGKSIEEYLTNTYYTGLGISRTCYNPRRFFGIDEMPPTEDDTIFRMQLVHGDVHDPGAALFGGVCGHAGLFSDANGIAKLFQMLIQGGTYGGTRYLKEETIREFTRYQFKNNRRGIGFDKPIPNRDGGPTCNAASDKSFGHSGFTGTYVWADPAYGLVYVFLSNRSHPVADNNKILKTGIRTEVQSIIYSALQAREN